MRRFQLVAMAYMAACLLGIAILVIRGEGPRPQIISLDPTNGSAYWPGGAASITFSHEMDQTSVERGLDVSPASEGQGIWRGTTLFLQPLGDWHPNVTYHVSLTGKVTDDEGRTLRTPVRFWFRVHHVHRVSFCSVDGIRNACERIGHQWRPLTRSRQPVLQVALAPDGSMLAYTRRDLSGLPHLFLTQLDGSGTLQLTHGRKYWDQSPFWSPGDTSSISYFRRPVKWYGSRPSLGKAQTWNVETDGSYNTQLKA